MLQAWRYCGGVLVCVKIGSSCRSVTLDPCASLPCHNNGTCVRNRAEGGQSQPAAATLAAEAAAAGGRSGEEGQGEGALSSAGESTSTSTSTTGASYWCKCSPGAPPPPHWQPPCKLWQQLRSQQTMMRTGS